MQAFTTPPIEQSNFDIRNAKPHEIWFIVLEDHNQHIDRYFDENMPVSGGFSVSKIRIIGFNDTPIRNVFWKYITQDNKEIACNKMDCRVCYSENLNDFEKNELMFSHYGNMDTTILAASVLAANQLPIMGPINNKQKRVKWFREDVAPENLLSIIIRHVVNYPDKINFDTLSPPPMGGNFSGWKGKLRSTRSKRNKKINRRSKKHTKNPPRKSNKKTNKRK